MGRSGALLLVLTAAIAGEVGAQSYEGARAGGRAVAAARATSEPVVLDGVPTDPVWQRAGAVDGFRQFDPELDAEPSQRTEFRVAYDSDDLYVFVRAYDSDPDRIMRALTRRDQRGPSDQIGILIDSYGDRRTGFSFYVNPDGVKRDFAIYDDTREDSSWDGVWDVATRVDSLGWTAEFRIPLSQLRYASADRQTFGFGVRREIERHPERLSWPRYSRTENGLMSQLGSLEGLEGLGRSRRVEITPYAITKNVTRPSSSGGAEHPQVFSAGADLKVGLTPNVTLDATVNPDFGQVEADPAAVNLTAFETFFGERRPFFTEGTGLYQFQINCYIVVDCSTNEGLFYSRRIGRSPTLLDLHGDARTPTSTRIAVAAKLTGRQPGGLSYGVLDAVTEHVAGANGQTAEPRTNYAVLRIQQDLREGDAGIGWIATAVNRHIDESTVPFLHESAYVTGLTARSRHDDRKYEVAASVALSRVAGSSQAMVRTQSNPTHRYQQPGDDLQVDSLRTSLGGYGLQAKVGKYGGGFTRFESSFVYQSGGFEVNDLGFLRRADILDWSTWAALSFQSPTSLYRWAQFNANHWQHWNTSGLKLESAVNLNAHMGAHNNWDFHLGGTVGSLGTTYCDRCSRGGSPIRRSRTFYPWFGFNTDSRRELSTGVWVNLGYWDETRSRSSSLSPYVTLRFSTSLTAQLGSRIYRAHDDSQWLGNFLDGLGATHHAFAHLDQRTVSLNVRLNYTVSPDLTFEFYGEPFASNGLYSDIRELSETPGAPAYDARFESYTPPSGTAASFSFRQIRTNAVLRWEFRPGSTLFLVWAHGREQFLQDQPRRAWLDELSGIFDLDADDTLLLKVSYWLNR